MNPVNYDLIVCVVSLIAGFFMFFKIGAFCRKSYTPMLFVMTIAGGILYWCSLLLATYAAIYHIPSWLDSSVNWAGTWGYTSGRILNSICWLLTLATLRWCLPIVRAWKAEQKNTAP